MAEAFSADSNAPWGFKHRGLDFFVDGSEAAFRAVTDGTITRIELRQNDISGNWQVNVVLTYSSTYSFEYSFEPMTLNAADGEAQLAAIVVSEGESVLQGQSLGDLLMKGGGTHVHFSMLVGGSSSCPESYFTDEARTSIMGLIDQQWPGSQMCYGE